jgi:hypothetical protein
MNKWLFFPLCKIEKGDARNCFPTVHYVNEVKLYLILLLVHFILFKGHYCLLLNAHAVMDFKTMTRWEVLNFWYPSSLVILLNMPIVISFLVTTHCQQGKIGLVLNVEISEKIYSIQQSRDRFIASFNNSIIANSLSSFHCVLMLPQKLGQWTSQLFTHSFLIGHSFDFHIIFLVDNEETNREYDKKKC